MKTVYYVRHAKSSWSEPGLSDHDRPLNKRGLRDAPIMASYLKSQGVDLDGLISSTANRARTTAGFFGRAFSLIESTLHEQGLYHSSPFTMLTYLHQLPPDWESVALFAHNPGMTMMANQYSPDFIDNVPTCGVFGVRYKADEWTDIAQDHSNGTWIDMWTPKTLDNV